MMRLFWLLFLWPSVVFAAPAEIRSGEHSSFSRLVVSIPNEAEWTISPSEAGYILTVSPLDEGFSTRNIFERIPRDRISNARSRGSNQLALDIGCDCHIDAFIWQPGKLVIDIIDGPAPEDLEIDDRILLRPEQDTQVVQELPDLLSLRSSRPQEFTLDLEQAAEQVVSVVPDLEATEAALIEALARAASQGFLEAPPQISAAADSEGNEVEEQTKTDLISEIPEEVPSPHPGVGFSTAFDRDLEIVGQALEQSLTRHCLPEDFFAMADWADDRALHVQTAELVEALVGEFGQEPLAAEDTLARIYIYFGFGAEARSVLARDPTLSQERQILVELAGVVDNERGPFELLLSQHNCETTGGMWAFLLDPKELESTARTRIMRDFFAIPQPLRSQLAPRMSEAFLKIGDADAADRALSATRNQDTESTHETQAARAEVAIEQDDPEFALDVLTEQADDNARTTPASVIRMINLALEEGTLPKEADLVLAGALRQEYRSDPIADDLEVAQARGHAALGEYETALDLMMGRDDANARAVNDEVFSLIARNSDVTRFLEFSYGAIPAGLTSTTENMIARRLLDLGFAERTGIFLTSSVRDDETAQERRYLRAEAALALRDFSGTIEALEGMSDDRARRLSAEAYSGMGNYEAALSEVPVNSAGPGLSDLQFRAQAWDSLREEEDPVLSSFAETILTDPQANPPTTLADRRALLGQAEQSRQNVEALLLRFDGVTGED